MGGQWLGLMVIWSTCARCEQRVLLLAEAAMFVLFVLLLFEAKKKKMFECELIRGILSFDMRKTGGATRNTGSMSCLAPSE